MKEEIMENAIDYEKLAIAMKDKPKKTLVGKKIGKWATIIILILTFGIGVFGSFNKVDFSMTNYVEFLESFKWYFMVISGGVGVGTSVKTISKVLTKKGEQE